MVIPIPAPDQQPYAVKTCSLAAFLAWMINSLVFLVHAHGRVVDGLGGKKGQRPGIGPSSKFRFRFRVEGVGFRLCSGGDDSALATDPKPKEVLATYTN